MTGLLDELEFELFPLVKEEMDAPRLCAGGGIGGACADPRRRIELAAFENARSDIFDSDLMRWLTDGRREGRPRGFEFDFGVLGVAHSTVALMSTFFSSREPFLTVGEEGRECEFLERSMGGRASSNAPAVEPHKRASMPLPRCRFRLERSVACVRAGKGQELELELARG